MQQQKTNKLKTPNKSFVFNDKYLQRFPQNLRIQHYILTATETSAEQNGNENVNKYVLKENRILVYFQNDKISDIKHRVLEVAWRTYSSDLSGTFQCTKLSSALSIVNSHNIMYMYKYLYFFLYYIQTKGVYINGKNQN